MTALSQETVGAQMRHTDWGLVPCDSTHRLDGGLESLSLKAQLPSTLPPSQALHVTGSNKAGLRTPRGSFREVSWAEQAPFALDEQIDFAETGNFSHSLSPKIEETLGCTGIWGIWLMLWSKCNVHFESDNLKVSCLYTSQKGFYWKSRDNHNQRMSQSNRMQGRMELVIEWNSPCSFGRL